MRFTRITLQEMEEFLQEKKGWKKSAKASGFEQLKQTELKNENIYSNNSFGWACSNRN